MGIFHLSIRPISRAKGQSAVAQIAYDTRSKLTNERTGEKLDWSKQQAGCDPMADHWTEDAAGRAGSAR
jgi:hypothetical protein